MEPTSQSGEPVAGAAGQQPLAGLAPDAKRPDKVHPYRLSFWCEVCSEDSTSEIMNVLGMMLSMLAILLKYKSCAWLGVLVAAVSYANARAQADAKQLMSTFMLSMSSVVMCYLASPQPMAAYLWPAEGSLDVAGGQRQ